MTPETETLRNVTKTFKYSYPTCTNKDVLFKLEVPVEIPHDGSTRELVQRVIRMFQIPVYLEDELNEKVAYFVLEETKNFHNERDEKLINQLKNSELNIEGIVKNWEKSFKDNVMEFAENKGTSDEEVFAAAYHKLVHSPALDTILSVETSYAKTYIELRKNRDEEIKQLTSNQTEEMEENVRQLNITTTEEDINDLAAQHFKEQALVSRRCGSELDALWQTQRTKFRSWLMETLDEYQSTAALNTPSNSPLGTFSPLSSDPERPLAPPHLEDSFTIHLGSQLKQTHNIRIVAADLLDLCTSEHLDNVWEPSLRLQSSLSLYSPELSGAVVACEAPPSRPAPPASTLAAAAAATTDYHFEHAHVQLRNIVEKVKEPVESRRRALGSEDARSRHGALGAGDVFITTHATLPDVHVLFHLIVDSHRHAEMTSRHPAILGLRNILKTACSNDVTNLTLPLLLTHELTEEMTVGWCVRRAELVLKCVKGFMLEAAGWGGAELRTLSVTLPRSTPPSLFSSLASLLPALFRLASPLDMRRLAAP